MDILTRKKTEPAIKARPQRQIKKNVTLAFDWDLVERTKRALASQHAAGNYKFANFSEVVRSSLLAYKQGQIQLGKIPTKYDQEVTVLFSGEVLKAYQELPNFNKREIISRCLESFLLVM
jgi:hypothetical protein